MSYTQTAGLTVESVTDFVGGTLLHGSAATKLQGFSSLREASDGDLSFFHDSRYGDTLRKTKASAVLMPMDWTAWPAETACIGVSDPSRAFEKLLDAYAFSAPVPAPGAHPSAVIAPSVRYDAAKTRVGANAVIEEGVVLGDGVDVGAGCYVGRNVQIGEGSRLSANCTVMAECTIGKRVVLHSGVVVGADGFGYEFEGGVHRKVRQWGTVQIDDDVEIGAGTTIDRARIGRTRIGEGTKIDNLVQIGHNVVIGRHCIIVACTAIAGSAVVGDYVVLAAQVGIVGHVTVGAGSRVGARSGVTKDLPGGRSYLGFPAVEATEERRRVASSRRLPRLVRRIEALESEVKTLSHDSTQVREGGEGPASPRGATT